MKKLLLFLGILMMVAVSFGQKKYTITRYEQKSDALFICINHKNKPVYVEHFFTEAERKDTASITDTVERLVAELYIKADAYNEPEKFVSKLDKAKRIENKTDTVRIKAKKTYLLAKALAEKDSVVAATAKAAEFKAGEAAPAIVPLELNQGQTP